MGKILNNMSENDYKIFIKEIKENVRLSQQRASIRVNSELIKLYWNIGKQIIERQNGYNWGDGFLKNLSKDLKKEFPSVKGFSSTNLKYMKSFYEFYSIGQQAVDQLEEKLTNIPWGHNVLIMQRAKTIDEALFYVEKTIENGWSRNILGIQLKSELYTRVGKAVTNFENRLPKIQSDLAIQTLKDPYNFDFLTISEDYNERELSRNLIEKISEFLIELGEGFAYIGKEYHLKVGADNFYIDLLFYNLKLHSYVVIELKTGKFKPEHLGQLNFYVTAVNHQLKTERDNQTVGILICGDKDDVVCKYSLENINQPIGVSSYEIGKLLKSEYHSPLPTIEELEKTLKEELK